MAPLQHPLIQLAAWPFTLTLSHNTDANARALMRNLLTMPQVTSDLITSSMVDSWARIVAADWETPSFSLLAPVKLTHKLRHCKEIRATVKISASLQIPVTFGIGQRLS